MKKVLNVFVSNAEEPDSFYKRLLNIGIVLFGMIAVFVVSIDEYEMKWSTLQGYTGKLLEGYEMTLVITFFAMIISLILGFVFAIMNKSRVLVLHYFSKIYVEIIRGTPFLVQIIFFFYIITPALGLDNRYMIGVVILAVFSSAYVTEIIRAGIESIEKSQHETAKAVGFTTYQKYRYVILPQVIKRIMPSLAGQLSSLVKDSSLLSVIAVSEFTLNIQEITAINFRTYENYIVLAVGYLLLTFPISLLSKRFERKYSYEA